MKTILFIVGTRPEAIKCAPLILKLRENSEYKVLLCATAQHRHMLDQVLSLFNLQPDFDLDLMTENQTLNSLTANCLLRLDPVLVEAKPDLVVVQGDTTTAMAGALAACYRRVPVAHLEAGLRTYNRQEPFPEETNREIVSRIATFHFCPTANSLEALRKENITENGWITGNSVIDALLTIEKILPQTMPEFSFIDPKKTLILVTGHRRENFGQPMRDMCQALLEIAEKFPGLQIVYPVHLNPNVQEVVKKILANNPQIFLIEPVPYDRLIWLMKHAKLIITDSGGIQEEGPSLGKPVLVTRNVTERPEGVAAGTSILVGTDRKKIVDTCTHLLTDPLAYDKIAKTSNPYGDGKTSEKIAALLAAHF